MELRKILTFVEEATSEAGQRADPPLRKVAVVAVLKNPFAGGYVADLTELTDASLAIGRRIAAQGVAGLCALARAKLR